MEDTNGTEVELVTKSDILGLNTWDRPRTNDELASFVTRRQAAVANITDED